MEPLILVHDSIPQQRKAFVVQEREQAALDREQEQQPYATRTRGYKVTASAVLAPLTVATAVTVNNDSVHAQQQVV